MPIKPALRSYLRQRLTWAAMKAGYTPNELVDKIPGAILPSYELRQVFNGDDSRLPVESTKWLAKTLKVSHYWLRSGNKPPAEFNAWMLAEKLKEKAEAEAAAKSNTGPGGPNARLFRLRCCAEQLDPAFRNFDEETFVKELAKRLEPLIVPLHTESAKRLDPSTVQPKIDYSDSIRAILDRRPVKQAHCWDALANLFNVSVMWLVYGTGVEPTGYRSAVRKHLNTADTEVSRPAANADVLLYIPNRVTFTLLAQLTWDTDINPKTLHTSKYWESTIEWLMANGLVELQEEKQGMPAHYAATDKGCFYIDHLRKIPLPVATTAFKIPQD